MAKIKAILNLHIKNKMERHRDEKNVYAARKVTPKEGSEESRVCSTNPQITNT